METPYVVGLPGRSGDPSPFTALGVFKSIQACCRHRYGDNNVAGKTIAVQGVGNVGYYLCKLLSEAGAKLIVSDVVAERVARCVEEFKATPVDKDAIYGVYADIFAPCALGAAINDETIPQLKCKIVCGGANNVLRDPLLHGRALQERGICYAPDYLANAGGVINVSYERAEGGYNEEASRRDIDRIYNRMREVLRISDETGQLPYQTADKLAEGRIEAMRNVKSILK
jgi:leucine dehydrogenase